MSRPFNAARPSTRSRRLAIALLAVALAVAVAGCGGTRSATPEDKWVDKAAPVAHSFSEIGKLHAAFLASVGVSKRADAKQAAVILAKIDTALRAARALPPAPPHLIAARADLLSAFENAHKAYADYVTGFTSDNETVLNRGDREWSATSSAAARFSREMLAANDAAGNDTAPEVSNLVAFASAVQAQQQELSRAKTLDNQFLSRYEAERNTARVRRLAGRTVTAYAALVKGAEAMLPGDEQTTALRGQYVDALRLSLRAAQGYQQALRAHSVAGLGRAARLDEDSAAAYAKFVQALQRYAQTLRSKG